MSKLVEAKARHGNSKYKKKYCKELIDHMSKGYSFETFGPSINVSTSSTYRWLQDPKNKDFREAKACAEGYNRLFWEKVGLAGVTGKLKGFNTSAWIFNMKNRFGWRDNHNVPEAPLKINSNGEEVLEEDTTPTFEVEMTEEGKFKSLKPRRIK